MLTSILTASLEKCREPIHKDSMIQELDAKLLELIEQLPQDSRNTMETVITKYKDRITRIAYLQGMKDIFDLFFTLSDEANDIIAAHDKK